MDISALAFGEPHIITFGGEQLLINEVGDFYLVEMIPPVAGVDHCVSMNYLSPDSTQLAAKLEALSSGKVMKTFGAQIRFLPGIWAPAMTMSVALGLSLLSLSLTFFLSLLSLSLYSFISLLYIYFIGVVGVQIDDNVIEVHQLLNAPQYDIEIFLNGNPIVNGTVDIPNLSISKVKGKQLIGLSGGVKIV